MTTTQKELKEGLTLNETVLDDGSGKHLSFTNSTVDKQFICKYSFKGEPEPLGITRIEDGKFIVSVHPGETQEFVKGKWNGLTKSVATGPPSKEWLEKKAGAAKDSNKEELEKVKELIAKAKLGDGATSEKVAELCVKNKLLFVDVNYLPLDCSLQAPWQKGEMKMFPFKRPVQWELLQDQGLKPQLFVNKIEPEDVNQGSLADCYLMGALGSVASQPEYVKSMFSDQQHPELGIYRVKLCKNAWWRTVVLDDFFPCSGPKPSFARNRDEPNELWVALAEKAYAKVNNSYFAMKTGQCAAALADLTGCPHATKAMADDLWDSILQQNKDGVMQVFGTPGKNLMYVDEKLQSPEDKKLWDKYRAVELICEHSYSVLKCLTTKSGARLCKLRNPWGTTNHGLWKGKWAMDDPVWTPEVKKEVGWGETDGVFWMCWEDCKEWFNSVSIGYTLQGWDSVRVAGKWNAGVPSVCIELDVKANTQMWVGLHQSDTRGLKPGSCPDASYAAMNLFVVAPKKEGVKIVESFGTSKRDRFGLLQLNPEVQGKLFVVGMPKDGALTKDFVLSLLIEKVDAVDVFFNGPKDATHAETGKDIKLDQWVGAERDYQVYGPTLSKGQIVEKRGRQLGAGAPASREASPKKKAVIHADPAVPPKSSIRSGSGGLPSTGAKEKASIRSKTTAAAGAKKPVQDITVEVGVVGASGLIAKGSQNPFCELKLRTVERGVVGSDHPNPQKQATKVVNKNLSPEWNEKFCFKVPSKDCIRISIFGKKMMGKDFLGRVDLLAEDLIETLEKGAPLKKTYQVTGEDEGRGPVAGTLDVSLKLL